MPQTLSKGFITGETLPLVKLEGADIVTEGNLVLSDVNFQVNRGELVYLVGKVGSGKSSILKTLDAELPVTKGKVRVGDYDLSCIKRSQVPLLRRNIGVVFQDFQLLTDRNVEENLMFVLKATGWKDPEKMNERCSEVLEMVGLKTKAHKIPYQLSGGEQQRVAIARAVAHKPKIIFADEPTGALDTNTGLGIIKLFKELIAKEGITIVMTTHDPNLMDFGDAVYEMEDGELKYVPAEQ